MTSSKSSSGQPPAPPSAATNGRRNKIGAAVAVVVLIAGSLLGFRHWRFTQTHAETDDAQLEGDISPVLPHVTGFVARVLVRDNQRVQAGEALVEIDPAELDLRVISADSALKGAEAALSTAEADVANAWQAEKVAQAEIAVAGVQRDKTASDLARDRNLFAGTAITDRQLSDSQAAADAAAAESAAMARRAAAAETQVAVAKSQLASARALIDARKAELEFARLQRSYATVTAPIAGKVSHKSVEPGELVQAGQTLMAITSDSGVWVVANFKETQLEHMKVGQPAVIEVDTYPGVEFHGKVQSLAGATGARFALLPPDNATGNFVKVTQRVPVKIELTDPADPAHVLRPGVSADATVSLDSP